MRVMIEKKDYLFTKKVWIQLKRYKHKSIKLLVSGGADSLALLLAASYCRDILNQKLDLEVITFNHGLRAAAKAEVLFVKQMCGQLRIPCRDINLCLKAGASMEEARNARYNFLKKYNKQVQNAVFMTGHHFNDQVETILMGLLGMTSSCSTRDVIKHISKEVNEEILLVRPLLDFTRQEIENFVNPIRWIEDPTNMNTKYTRNLVRHEILPILEKYIPNLKTSLVKRFG